MRPRILLVQPYGRRPREATVLSEHATTEAAYAELDRLAEVARRYNIQLDTWIEVRVVTADDFTPVARPRLQVQ